MQEFACFDLNAFISFLQVFMLFFVPLSAYAYMCYVLIEEGSQV